MRDAPTFPTDKLRIVAWPDEILDRVGHDARARYVETYWLGVLGPSTTWLLRHLADELEGNPYGFVLHLPETASRLGLGLRDGRNSPFMRALSRLVQFEMAMPYGSDGLAVRRRVPSLSRRHLMRLPDTMQARHDHWVRQHAAAAEPVAAG